MIKPLLIAVAAASVAGGTVAGVYYAVPRSEEEVLRQVEVATPTPVASVASTASPSPTPTPAPDGWQTYTDPELGFSFPYPPGLTLSTEFFDYPEKGGNPAVRARLVRFFDYRGGPALSVSIVPNPNNLSLGEWMDVYGQCPSRPELPQPENLTIAGEPAVQCAIGLLGGPAQIGSEVFFRRGTFFYSLAGRTQEGMPPLISEAHFQRVIDGFRFGP